MKRAEIKELSENDLQDKLSEKKAALGKMRFNHSVSGIENPMQIREVRKDIARINTEITARKKSTEKAEK